MRDVVYMSGILCLFAMLAAEFPEFPPAGPEVSRGVESFASFVELSPEAHALCLESAKMSWRIGGVARPRASIGSLDAGIPLLTDFLPPLDGPRFADVAVSGNPLAAADIGTYSLRPASLGRDMPEFAQKPAGATSGAGSASATAGFSREDMLSLENMHKMKEMVK